MAWEGGYQWLAGLFLDRLHSHLNLLKSCPPAPSECSSMTPPGCQPLADRSRWKTLNDLVTRSTSQLSAGRRGRGSFGSLVAFDFVVSWTRHIYICLGALGFCGQTGKKKKKHWRRLCSELAPELWVTGGVYFSTDSPTLQMHFCRQFLPGRKAPGSPNVRLLIMHMPSQFPGSLSLN